MKSTLRIALIGGLLLVTTNAMADFATMGIGTFTCGKFAEEYRTGSPTEVENVYFTWAQGFMSAANIGLKSGSYRDMSAMTLDAEKEFVRNYCGEHPLARYFQAVMELWLKLPMKKTAMKKAAPSH
jgi:hypothetical protein